MTNFESVKKFMTVMEQEVLTTPTVPSEDVVDLRFNLIKEETDETLNALKMLQLVLDSDIIQDFDLESNTITLVESVIGTEQLEAYISMCLETFASSSNPEYIQQFVERDQVINFSSFLLDVIKELIVELADGLCDILVVTYGAAAAFGIDIDRCMLEVNRSNMSKLHPETGKPVKRESDGKVIKDFPGSQYSPPQLKAILFPNSTK